MNPEIVKLFLLFSKFEHSTIRAGYIKNPTKNGPAHACWKRLSNELPLTLFENLRKDSKTSILWASPPNQWWIVDGNLIWTKRKDSTFDLEPVTWVRHCVVHGESQGRVERHSELVSASIAVIYRVLEECAKPTSKECLRNLHQFFEDARPYVCSKDRG